MSCSAGGLLRHVPQNYLLSLFRTRQVFARIEKFSSLSGSDFYFCRIHLERCCFVKKRKLTWKRLNGRNAITQAP